MKPLKMYAVVGVLACVAGLTVSADTLFFDTEMLSMDLTGGPFPMPLASDPGNLLGDSIEGYGYVDSQVTISLSPETGDGRSLGTAVAHPVGTQLPWPPPRDPPPINPDQLHGQDFVVDSFFDVFFDITVTDADPRPGRDYAGQPDGTSITLPGNGPGQMASLSQETFDKDAPNFGLIPPPEDSPFIGPLDFVIPLGGDINGNGEDDKMLFLFTVNSLLDQNRTSITLPDGTVLDEFFVASYVEGAVIDVSSDPPFMIGATLPGGLPDPGAFGGPASTTATLLNPIVTGVIPEPGTGLLALIGLLGLGLCRRR